eukprot:gnl/TRDRNA2_/TRDRNA2_176665_c7_seq13.p1 gnl/TRDRNA2_/TRDRNA2_176665_c7~~gnl/TRDRNA2_/TRDRNA2_176665_c7_seq13.p1  ORF type:complete len:690 (+),score=275.16 gnl/TRDRNA2_/TRDRNA2_176665_c7_seq13:67-2136(+)
MNRVAACLCFLCLVQASAAASLDAKLSPIQKVVKMLEEMKATVSKEGEADAASYDKYKCWCETNSAEKTEAIANAEAKIEELTSLIEELAGAEGKLKTEIEALEADIAEDKDALESAAEMKEKETAEFSADEAYMKETLASLKEALEILGKVQLLQKEHKAADAGAALIQVRNVLEKHSPKFRGQIQKDFMGFLGAIKDMSAEQAGAMIQEPIEGGGAAAGAKSYNSRSGQIFGVLGGMSDEFKSDLTSAQKEELMAIIQFQKLSAAKTAEIMAATSQKEQKETELAETMAKAAQAKEDLEATKSVLASDQSFLADVTKECEVVDQEYEARVKVRNEELLALSETLKIVTSDEARDLFGKTISFIQVSAVRQSGTVQVSAQERAKASAMRRIMKTAAKNKNWALASLAVHLSLDGFVKVKAAMDKMLVQLKKQQEEEYDKNEFCKKSIDETEDNIKVAQNEKDDLGETHTSITNEIETLTTDIKTLKAEVADMEIALKQAGEQRKTENLQFQQEVSDARATIKILNMALDRLKEFYNKSDLLQVKKQAQPEKPGGYEKSGSAGGVMQMLAKIISDAEIMEQDLVMTEKNSQEDYVTFVSEATNSIEADRGAIAEKEEQLAQTEALKSENSEALMANGAETAKLKELLAARHVECDYVMKYFETRQKARKEEMDGIEEAKAILSGADFGR